MSFSIATYNVLATAYMQPAQYRRSPAMVLKPEWRVPALVQYITSLATDVICLQETETNIFSALRARLAPLGYASEYARKGSGRPDGCATFFRQAAFELVDTHIIQYADATGATPNTGHIALVVTLRTAGREVGIVNTHLAWDPPETPVAHRRGYRQIQQLLGECGKMAASCHAWLICGDLNATPSSEIVSALEEKGLQCAHRGLAETYTCNVNGQAKMIDYLFHSPTLRSQPKPVLRISDQTPLPSAEQPSDHLPVVADFYWKT